MSDDRDAEKYSGSESDGDELDGAEGNEDLIRQLLNLQLGTKTKRELPKVLDEVSFDGIVKYIKDGKAKNIITMAGAGISTSAGIPDFRTPGTGLYGNLQKYDLPSPEAMFDIQYFKLNPQPFFDLAKELYPGSFHPTPCHRFIRLLSDKGVLLRHYTQNIDTLERIAGIPEEKIVEAHGTFHTAHCIDAKCNTEYSQDWLKEEIFKDVIPTCEKCNTLVKPDIVFFGENLPERFFKCMMTDFKTCDLLIILGTSLKVFPFAGLIDRVPAECPRLLINMEIVGEGPTLLGMGGAMDFDSEECYRDVAKIGPCDDGCIELATALGWKDDLDLLMKKPETVETEKS